MHKLERSEIRRRALRAAAAVALTVTACGDPAAADLTGPAPTSADASQSEVAAARQPGQSDVASGETAAGETTAGEITGDGDGAVGANDTDGAGDTPFVDSAQGADATSAAEVAQGADAKADTAGHCDNTQPWRIYQACCEAVNWDWDKGCQAWGPPAPPAMVKRARSLFEVA